MYDSRCEECGYPWVCFNYMSSGDSVSKKSKQPLKPVDQVEPIARNDKNRVRMYLHDCLDSLTAGPNNDDKRREAVHTLHTMLPTVSAVELEDHRERLANSLFTHSLSSLQLTDSDSERVTAVRALAVLRCPDAMVQAAITSIFNKSGLGLHEKVQVVTSVVRACQCAVGRTPYPHLTVPVDTVDPVVTRERIACGFVEGCLQMVPVRKRFMRFQGGFIGERVLLAMATMLVAVPQPRLPGILTRIADTLSDLVLDNASTKLCGTRRGALVLLMAACGRAREARVDVLDAAPFITGCGKFIELVLGGGGGGEEREMGLQLAAMVREAFPMAKVIEGLVRREFVNGYDDHDFTTTTTTSTSTTTTTNVILPPASHYYY
jgi:hypothetical protein